MSRPAAKRKYDVRKRRLFAGTNPGARANVHKLSDEELSARMPHRRDLPDPHSANAITTFGHLFELGHLGAKNGIGQDRKIAGEKYKTIVLKYLASIEKPKDGPGGGRGYPCSGEKTCGQDRSLPHCECKARKEAYNEATGCMFGDCKAEFEVSWMVVHGRECRDIRHLLRGLDRLVQHLLTNQKKYAYR